MRTGNCATHVCLLLVASLFFVPGIAEAKKKCKKGYYKEGITGVCLPKGGTVVKQLDPTNTVKTALKVGNAVVQGDVKGIVQGAGSLIVNNACLLCTSVAKGNFSEADVALAEELVGRGVLFYATGEPLFLIVDVDTSSATQHSARRQTDSSTQQTKPAAREKRSFTFAGASCIVQEDKSGKVTAAWPSAPKGTDNKTNATVVYPEVDLWPGDTITVTAPVCPKQTIKGSQTSVTQTTFVYQWSNILPGAGTDRMRYMLGGDPIKGATNT